MGFIGSLVLTLAFIFSVVFSTTCLLSEYNLLADDISEAMEPIFELRALYPNISQYMIWIGFVFNVSASILFAIDFICLFIRWGGRFLILISDVSYAIIASFVCYTAFFLVYHWFPELVPALPSMILGKILNIIKALVAVGQKRVENMEIEDSMNEFVEDMGENISNVFTAAKGTFGDLVIAIPTNIVNIILIFVIISDIVFVFRVTKEGNKK
ncbi:hypothetical protein ADUPG1_006030 [Aduncisulcus paluster]|uniref:Uncharacterized protein n=1 Tax=Aduncisulcus paluster TaxID=2918883 RepID=A0ABQ5KJM2_9EUKA|nr:hypothetical protein ADUPG1_006030 [Aduncisulcus paluster]